MAQKHNEQYVNAPMTRLGTIGWPDQDRRVIRSSAFVASKWTAENPILQLGEVGYETDTNKLKVGDGVTKWNDLPYAGDGTGSLLPDQTGQSGKFLTTDGTDASWAAVDALPSQTGNAGKFLTTDGTDASWSDTIDTTAIGSLKILTNGTTNDIFLREKNASLGCHISCLGNDLYVSSASNIQIATTIVPALSGWYSFGSSSKKWVTAYLTKLNNGADITVPTTGGTMAVIGVNTTATLAVADWSSSTQTVTVSGVTATSVVFVSPAPASASDYASAGILCTAQAANSLTFTCTTTPTNAITVNVVCM